MSTTRARAFILEIALGTALQVPEIREILNSKKIIFSLTPFIISPCAAIVKRNFLHAPNQPAEHIAERFCLILS